MGEIEAIREDMKLMGEIHNELNRRGVKLFSLTISGSHLYGFNSEDSDVDYRGIFQESTDHFLTLNNPKEVVELKNVGTDLDDIVLFELKKEIELAITGNCNVLEHMNAPQIYKTADFVKLKQLINNAWGKKGIYNSYRGMALFNYKKFILQGKRSPKKYLYVYRGLMAGIYALQTGTIQPNLEELNQYFKLDEVKWLIKTKKETKEWTAMPEDTPKTLESTIEDLLQRLDKAYLSSKIPETPQEKEINDLNEWLYKIRCENMRGGSK